jgi:hypothetical protein
MVILGVEIGDHAIEALDPLVGHGADEHISLDRAGGQQHCSIPRGPGSVHHGGLDR